MPAIAHVNPPAAPVCAPASVECPACGGAGRVLMTVKRTDKAGWTRLRERAVLCFPCKGQGRVGRE